MPPRSRLLCRCLLCSFGLDLEIIVRELEDIVAFDLAQLAGPIRVDVRGECGGTDGNLVQVGQRARLRRVLGFRYSMGLPAVLDKRAVRRAYPISYTQRQSLGSPRSTIHHSSPRYTTACVLLTAISFSRTLS